MDVELGYNEEEMKLVKETRKIWKNPNVRQMWGGCWHALTAKGGVEVAGWLGVVFVLGGLWQWLPIWVHLARTGLLAR